MNLIYFHLKIFDPSDLFVPPDIKQVTISPDEIKDRKAFDKLSSASNRQTYQQKVVASLQKGATGPISVSNESEIIKVDEVKNNIFSAQVKLLLFLIVVLLLILIFKK